MNEHSRATNEPTPLRADLFSALLAEFISELSTTEEFRKNVAGYFESRLDSVADDLAQELCDNITQNIDVDDIIRNSGALSSLEERLGEHLQGIVDNIEI